MLKSIQQSRILKSLWSMVIWNVYIIVFLLLRRRFRTFFLRDQSVPQTIFWVVVTPGKNEENEKLGGKLQEAECYIL